MKSNQVTTPAERRQPGRSINENWYYGEFGSMGRPGLQSPVKEWAKGDFSEEERREIEERLGVGR